ncbi:MAG: PKD domain-containing protein, partial [Flavobacteriales bacterium]
PLPSAPAIAIDPATGLLTLTPTQQGNFTVGVRVQEYRNGQLLNETRRDFLFQVVACNAAVAAAIQQQAVFCESLFIQFQNNSAGASSYLWDFGDPAADFDTSTEENPAWAYSAPGTYTVTLIANPGSTCADTSVAEFQVYLTPSPAVIPPAPFCGNAPVTLVADGDFMPGASILWQLGAGSQPQTSTDSVVTVQFAGPGTHEVTLIVAQNGCTGFYTDVVTNYGLPDAGFAADPEPPQMIGAPVVFTDTSNPNGGTIAAWTWAMDGRVFAPSAPTAVWNGGWPGQYVVTLTITTTDGCSATASLVYEVIGGPIGIPNVFSPNGDVQNEFFTIANLQYYPNELAIYGRWGNKVYEALNYKNTWKADDVPDGTYFYVLRLPDQREYTGHVTILR